MQSVGRPRVPLLPSPMGRFATGAWLQRQGSMRAALVEPSFTASLQTVSTGVATAVLPISQPILADPLRVVLAEVVRESVAEGIREGLASERSTAEALTIIAIPFAPAGFVGFIVAAFSNAQDGAVWAIATLLTVAILLRQPIADSARRLMPPSDGE
jgi:hypothetical protein